MLFTHQILVGIRTNVDEIWWVGVVCVNQLLLFQVFRGRMEV